MIMLAIKVHLDCLDCTVKDIKFVIDWERFAIADELLDQQPARDATISPFVEPSPIV